jgi:predicted DNA-binding WGR domain protein
VNFQYGRIGSALKPGTKTPAPKAYDDAERIYNKLVAEKVREGYKVVSNGNGTAPSVPVPVPSQPALQTFLPCELLEEITEGEAVALICDGRYYMQQKMDGQRRRVIKRNGQVFGLNRRAEPVPLSKPLHDELAQLPLESFDLDGEIVGESLIVFDALDLDGDISTTAYSARFYRLLDLFEDWRKGTLGELSPRQHLQPCPTWFSANDKAKAYRAQVEKRAEGVVFKLASAPYRAGRNGSHFKMKFVKSASCKVLRTREGDKDNAVLALLDHDGQWREVGKASTLGKGHIETGQIVEALYLYATEGRRLYQPRIIGLRTDLDDSACTITQLRFKEGVEA